MSPGPSGPDLGLPQPGSRAGLNKFRTQESLQRV